MRECCRNKPFQLMEIIVSNAIVGPVPSDLRAYFSGERFVMATAFYSASRLDATTIRTRSLELLVRLDLERPDEWISRSVAPDALLEFIDRHADVDISLYCGPRAHAKVYMGDDSFLVGSANYTVRGFSGTSSELMWREGSIAATQTMRRALRAYRKTLKPLTRDGLAEYVARFADEVQKRQSSANRSPEDSLPPDSTRAARTGSYSRFLVWLESKGSAAREVLDRANGKSNLSGHIRMNFYGVRQFLIARPAHGRRLRNTSPEGYKVAYDVGLQEDLKRFVRREATDEDGLVVDTWRTYLPVGLGGKATSGGGTQGNLNRMLPLMARYLRAVC